MPMAKNVPEKLQFAWWIETELMENWIKFSQIFLAFINRNISLPGMYFSTGIKNDLAQGEIPQPIEPWIVDTLNWQITERFCEDFENYTWNQGF